MLQDRVNDAAVALQQVLGPASIKFSFCGGHDITARGGARESNDIDCVAQITKEEAISLLDKQNNFTVMPQTQEDYAAFSWLAPGDSQDNSFLVKIFPEPFSAESVTDTPWMTQPESPELKLGSQQSTFVDPFELYASKLCADGTRKMSHDSADLRVLMAVHGDQIRTTPKI